MNRLLKDKYRNNLHKKFEIIALCYTFVFIMYYIIIEFVVL